MIPSFFGVLLWAYHIYLSTQYEPKENEPDSAVLNYFAILDT